MSRWDDFTIRLHPDDDVAVAVKPIPAGTSFESPEGAAQTEAIPFCHTVALRFIDAGGPVKKFGQVIGFASKSISPGGHVHSHNLECGDYSRDADSLPTPVVTPRRSDRRTFEGYLRPDGRVGTRNFLA